MLARNAEVAAIAAAVEGVRGGEASATGSSVMLAFGVECWRWAALLPLLGDLGESMAQTGGEAVAPTVSKSRRVGLIKAALDGPACDFGRLL
nr:unnamed protein product [Digitaria exilis]